MTTPYKHLPKTIPSGKSEVLDIEIARLKTPDGVSVPIVATTHADHISLFWWVGAWRSREREHSRFDQLNYLPAGGQSPLVGRVFAPLTRAPWSQRIGLAAGKSRVFLAYKRGGIHAANGQPRSGLFIEGFRWDESSPNKLVSVSRFPIRIPVESLGLGQAGYYLWTGFSETTDQLVVLAQTVPANPGTEPSLTLLHTRSYQNLEGLELASGWSTAQIDAGGFDFDALLEDINLHILYRTAGQALKVPVNIPEFDSTELFSSTESALPRSDDNVYEQLTFRTVKLPEMQTLQLISDIPGGEHPQILRTVDPLLITEDRIESGSIRIERFRLLPYGEGRVYIRPRVSSSRKMLLRKVGNEWRTALLMTIPELAEVRNQSLRVDATPPFACHSRFDELVSIPDPSVQAIHWMKPHGQLPVHMTRFGHVPEEKALEIDLLHHDATYDGLIVSRYRFSESATISEASRVGFAVFDISHDQIPPCDSFEPAAVQENNQFGPFSVNSVVAPQLTDDLALILQKKTVDNVMGGSLIAERGSGTKYVAYTDLGDGGARVIFDNSLPTPDAKYQEGKLMDPSSVVGPGSTTEKWIILSQTDEKDYQMDPISNVFGAGPMVTNYDGMIDTLFALAGSSTEITLTQGTIQSLQSDPLLNLFPSLASSELPAESAARLSRREVSFSTELGQADPSPQRLSVVNVGDGDLSYPTLTVDYLENVGGWINAYVLGANNNYEVCIEPRIAGLASGSYNAAVKVSAGSNAPQLISVSLAIRTTGPSVWLSTPVVHLAGDQNTPGPHAGVVEVQNGGGGTLGPLTLNVTYAPGGSGWLQANVVTGAIRVEAHASSLSAGDYRAFVQVSTPSSSKSFDTFFHVSSPSPSISWNPDTLNFQRRLENGDPRAQTVYIVASSGMPPPRIDHIQYLTVPDGWLHTAVSRSFGGYRLTAQPDTTGLMPGTHKANIVLSDPSGAVEPWEIPVILEVTPPPSFAAFQYPSIVFAGSQVSFDASPTRFWGYQRDELNYVWRVERLDQGAQWINEANVGPTNDPVLSYAFNASGALEDPRRRITLTVTAPDTTSSDTSKVIAIQQSIWDTIWGFHEQLNEKDEDNRRYEIGDASLEFSKYRFEFELSDSGDRERVRIIRHSKYDAIYSFGGASKGQGHIYLRLPIAFGSEDVDVKGGAGAFYSVDKVSVSLSYGRSFTPGILTVDRRENTIFGSPIDTVSEHVSALSTKPIGNSVFLVPFVDVKGGLTVLSHALLVIASVIIAALLFWGLVALATTIGGMLAAIAAAASSGPWGWIIAAALAVALIVILETRVPPAIERAVERAIADQLASPERNFKANLDASGLLTYAGEGLAEEIATRALEQEGIAGERGANRFKLDFWQIVFVSEGHAKLLVRKPA